MSDKYKTEYANLELDNTRVGKFEYELGIHLHKKKLVLIFSEEELKGFADFINNFLESKS
jgi:hypothetical protein